MEWKGSGAERVSGLTVLEWDVRQDWRFWSGTGVGRQGRRQDWRIWIGKSVMTDDSGMESVPGRRLTGWNFNIDDSGVEGLSGPAITGAQCVRDDRSGSGMLVWIRFSGM